MRFVLVISDLVIAIHGQIVEPNGIGRAQQTAIPRLFYVKMALYFMFYIISEVGGGRKVYRLKL